MATAIAGNTGAATRRVLASYSQLERSTQQMLALLAGWTPDQLQFRPQPGAWSALDVIEHLMLTEKSVLEGMQRNVGKGHAVTVGGRCRSAMVLAVMGLPTRVKVPASVTFVLPSAASTNLPAAAASWERDREQFTHFLEGLSNAQCKEGLFKHPIGGWATAAGAVLFLRAHQRHHRYQLSRLQKASAGGTIAVDA